MIPANMSIATLRAAYANATTTPRAMIEALLTTIAICPDQAIWITLAPADTLLVRADTLAGDPTALARLPLFGIPFAVKDNIDVAGLPTTAACPDFAYIPTQNATCVQRLLDAGAILIGKTNMDQFATGLVGTRSPYGAPSCVFDASRVSGGSSSGSAVAVARGQVCFALGTDTAGSGRVPAAFNSIVGLKPTRGIISAAGVVPACQTLDCVSIFANSATDAQNVLAILATVDAADPLSRADTPRALPARPRIGVLAAADRAFGDSAYAKAYANTIAQTRAAGYAVSDIPYAAFAETAALLYAGPYLAERFAAIGKFIEQNPTAIDASVRQIIMSGRDIPAHSLFSATIRLATLRQHINAAIADIDVLLLPTAPYLPTKAAIAADPIGANARLGAWTNFVNLADLAAIAVPASFTPSGLPFGVTLLAPAFTDSALADLGGTLQHLYGAGVGITRAPPVSPHPGPPPGPPGPHMTIVVAGAHLTGMPLNPQLLALGAILKTATTTAPNYCLYALAGTVPAKPGLVRVAPGRGAAIAVEIWEMSPQAFAQFVAAIPAPLGIGKVDLADGAHLPGFICEPIALAGATDITQFGGWRAYINSQT